MTTDLAAQSARLPLVAHPARRTDLWVRVFGGCYRFWLSPAQIDKLEAEFAWTDAQGIRRASGILRVYGAVAKGRYEIEGRSVGFAAEGEASARECRRIIVEGLMGGRAALLDGECVAIDRAKAAQIVEAHLTGAPVADAWGLAFAILAATIEGREPTEAERGKPSTIAIIPDPESVAALIVDQDAVDMRL